MPTRVHLSDDGRNWTLEVSGAEVQFVDVHETWHVERRDTGRLTATAVGTSIYGTAVRDGNVVWVDVEGAVFAFAIGSSATQKSASEDAALAPPMPATVVRVAVTEGQTVRQGDLLVALEAMKMELPIRAPRDGVVRAVHCREGELVQPGHVLVEM